MPEEKPSLEGRKAKCTFNHPNGEDVTDSDWNLPFFEHHPEEKFDRYYCGCKGFG